MFYPVTNYRPAITMLDTLVKDSNQLTNEVLVLQPVVDSGGNILDFTWTRLNSVDNDSHNLLLGEDPGPKSVELFDRYKAVFSTGQVDNFLFSYRNTSDIICYEIAVAKLDERLIVSCNNVTEEKLTKKKLKDIDRNYKLITENATDVICRIDLKSKFLYVSPSSKKILGFYPEELLGISFYNYVHSDDIEELKKENTRMLRENTESIFQFRFRRKSDSTWVWLETHTKPVKNDSGEWVEVQSSVRDITSRKMAEEELYKLNMELEQRVGERNAELNTVLQHAPIILWSVNKDGVITYSKGKGLEGIGLKQNEAVGQSIYEVYPNIVKNVEKVLSGEVVNDTRAFENRHYQEHYFPARKANQDIYGVIAISIDISEQVLAQQALAASEAKYKAMVNGIPQLVWTASPEGNIDFCNKNWYDYTGLSLEESLGEGWVNAVCPDDLPNIHQRLEESVTTGKMLMFEARYRRRDGVYRWHLVRVWGAKNQEGEIIKWLGTATDIHEQKEYNKHLQSKNLELAKTNNDLDNFIYTASHDLKAPISNMEGLFSSIQQEISDACQQDIGMMVKMAEESLVRLRNTIHELTEIGRIQRDERSDIVLINIPDVIEDFKLDHRQELLETDAEFKVSLQTDTFEFSIKNFKTIMYNLLSNAIKYRHPERKPIVEIDVRITEAKCLLLAVRDNGLGFYEEEKEKIFGMYKRLHSHVEGTGIGLYIVKRVIQNSGGRIEVDSKPGEGTTFRVYLNYKQ